MRKLLVTGFGPFPSVPRNPSGVLARGVAASPRWRVLGIEAGCLVLPTTYRALGTSLAPALARAPDAVLMIGVAARSRVVRVEWRATARRSLLFPDAAGALAGKPVLACREPGRRTSVAPVKALRPLRAAGIPSRISRDAGRYLCNAAYHQALASPCPVLFVHVPLPPRPRAGARRRGAGWETSLTRALVTVAAGLLRAGATDRHAKRRRATVNRAGPRP